MSRIIIVDDELNIIKTITSILKDDGHTVMSASTKKEFHDLLKFEEFDLALIDVWLPDCDGLELLSEIKKRNSEVSVIMISGHGSIDIAVKSTRMGAFDFLEKPLSMERILTAVNNSLEQLRLKRENIKLKQISKLEDEMIGVSDKILEIKSIIETAARTDARVLITGKSGTGKELIAKAIYQRSKRSGKSFIKINCAAIPEELIESELFGHEKGSFTGAISRRIGKFEAANNGTLFLDEICNMSLSAQAKVLRVLQEQEFERVGGNDTIKVDVRVIAATNIDIKAAIEEGKFREDLYYRLNVIPIYAPPLAGRNEDIEALMNYFLDKFCDEHGIGKKSISDEGLELLKSCSWPGNVRELKNLAERLVVMVSRELISDSDIKKYLESYDYDDLISQNLSTLKRARELFEKEYIIAALKKNAKNISAAAKQLGIERTNLHRKIGNYNIDVDKI
jgi:two-component system nitrogen regulation response regulator NtrX